MQRNFLLRNSRRFRRHSNSPRAKIAPHCAVKMQIKGVCHVHSKYSHDGEIPLAELKEYFKQKGFQFLLLTEHLQDVSEQKIQQIIDDCRSLSDSEFILIPGLELDDNNKHFLIIGIDGSQNSTEELIKRSLPNKIVIWAHPFFIGMPGDEEILVYPIDGLEIWNSVYDGKKFPRWQSLKLLEKLRHKMKIYGFGGIDFHRFSHAGGPFLLLEAQNLSQDDILKNLQAGDYSIKNGDLAVGPEGNLAGGQKIKIKLISPLICWSLGLIRFASRILYILKISPPKKIKESIRSKI